MTCSLLLTAPLAAAEDTVIVSSANSGEARITLRGRVLDYNGRQLTLETTAGVQREIPASQVIEIQTPLSAEQQAADALVAARQYQAALAKYLEASRTENRRWMRHRILGQLVLCQRELGAWDVAGEYFLGLLRDDPASPYFHLIPLAWATTPSAPNVEQKARQWLARQDSPVARLLGASHLLASADRGQAVAELQRLSAATDKTIAALAAAQLWRTHLAEATPESLAARSDTIQRLPTGLRAGPYLVLGQALARQGQADDALLALLRVPVLYPEERLLAGEALWLAAETLNRGDRAAEAKRLYLELLSDYPDSRHAPEAKSRLEG